LIQPIDIGHIDSINEIARRYIDYIDDEPQTIASFRQKLVNGLTDKPYEVRAHCSWSPSRGATEMEKAC
jgi:hypothetical protein